MAAHWLSSFEKGPAKFFALYSTRIDRPQLEWLDKELSGSGSQWKIAYFHHPLYSTGGTHGPEVAVREVVEPLLVKYGVDVVFTGHEHFYERIKPQKGDITYFISGAGGQLRKGDLHREDPMAAGYDQDRSFMLVEVAGNQMYFQSITRTGQIVDSGVIANIPDPKRSSEVTSPTALPASPLSTKP